LAQQVLVRFVRRDGEWAPDPATRSPGRGAYLCSPSCAERVLKNRRYPGLSAAARAAFASEALRSPQTKV